MRLLSSLVVVLVSTSAFADAYYCGQYSAQLKNGKSIEIKSHGAASKDDGSGYTDKKTEISGAMKKSCDEVFDPAIHSQACGVEVYKVNLITAEGCDD